MLSLWKTSFTKYTALLPFANLCSSRSYCVSPVLEKYLNMGKKSKKKNVSKSPEKSENKTLTKKSENKTVANARNQNKVNENDLTSLLKNFPDPSHSVMVFFANLALQKQSPRYVLIPEFVISGDVVKCTLKLKYPEKIELNSYGNSKKNALKYCSLEVLQFLKANGHINAKNRFNIVEESKTNKSKNKKNNSLGPFKNHLLDENKNFTLNNLCIQRNFSTSSRFDLRNQVLEEPKHTKPKHTELKISQPPKSVIHNYYSLVSNYLDEDYKPTVHYEQLSSKNQLWTCTYEIRWPEQKTFAKSGRTKREAAGKVCLEILKYLNTLKLIDPYGRPIFQEEQRSGQKQTAKIISLKDTTVKRLNEIYDIYTKEITKNLTDSSDNFSDNTIEEDDDLFSIQRSIKKYRSGVYMAKEKNVLPISKFKDGLIETIKSNQVVIVKGEPGCGKSTRIPQYILEGWAKDDGMNEIPCRIIVTQPRRIAAISLAERVASERDENVGQIVGYQVRLQNSFDPRTNRILYCTTGILLRKMQSDPNLYGCSHVVLDEVHERDVNTDLLMNLLRRALKTNKDLKVVIMSATIDTGIFQNYFNGAPIFHVPGFTYPVKQHFIDQCASIDFSKTLQMCEGKAPNVVCEDVLKTIEYIHKNKGDGAILCFLPGWEDIKTVAKLLPDSWDMQVLCLHSKLSMKEQKLIFSKPRKGVRKIILSTNIAETSVTIDDVVYVIDTGIQKETKFDSSKGVTCLDNSWISQANVQQRKGRAGRCRPGESFHLYPKQKWEEFDEFAVPEILRTSLTKIVLDGKVYSNNMNATEFLSQLITPPSIEAVQLAIKELTELELLDANENLTPLGRMLSNFQLEPKLAKTLVNAMIFKCVTPIVDIVTLFSEEKELFSNGLYNKEEVKKFKRNYSRNSDHLALMKIFERWLEYVETDRDRDAQRFCFENNLVESKLNTLQQLRDIHFDYLEKYLKDVLPISDDLSDNDELIKGVLLSGVGTLIEHTEKLKGKKKKHLLLTRNNHKAMITSESVNGKCSSFSSDYLVYVNEMVSTIRKTSIIRETSMVSLLTVLLFKNNRIILEDLPKEYHSSNVNSTDQVLLMLENTEYKYVCDTQQAHIIKNCKEALQSMLQYYIFQLTSGGICNEDINKDWDRVLSVLNKTLEEVQI